MPSESTRFCKSCKRDLPLSAFDHKMVNYPKSDPRYGACLRKQGLRPQCHECVSRVAQERSVAMAINPSGLCQCGCGQAVNPPERPTRRHRFLPGHQFRTTPQRYVIEPVTGCWIWQWSKDHNGYGVACLNGRRMGAHRAVYIEHRGRIPDGLFLDHLCRNPICVNPDHLEPVTPRENLLRGLGGKLTPEMVREIRRLEGVIPRKEIAARFGITTPYVCRIVNRNVWTEVD
jgi:hypothetical protein